MLHFGIDFGTANTRISLSDGPGLPAPLPIGRSGAPSPYMMPSACWVDRHGDIIVGEHAVGQPTRLKFIKRYWQDRLEDKATNPWTEGRREVGGRTFTCEEMIEHVIGEALSRAFEQAGPKATSEGFTANVVCPVEFDTSRRLKLTEVLLRRGAKLATLSNVIDEPLAAALLYGRLETTPPTKLDILVFDAGAGTVDAAVVRYQEDEDGKRMTVLAEQGRCSAGSDLDRAMEDLMADRLIVATPGISRLDIYDAYGGGQRDVGQVRFEEECEQTKFALATGESFPFRKVDFLGQAELAFSVGRSAFATKAHAVLQSMESLVISVIKEARSFASDFEGVNLLVLVGGTSKLPLVAEVVEKHCPGAARVSSTTLDEMLATVRGVGFKKDFKDLVLKRPPYTTELRVRLRDGSSHALHISKAFEPFDWRLSYTTSIPYHKVERQFDSAIDTSDLSFISPNGEALVVEAKQFPRDALRGTRFISARLDIRGRLEINGRQIEAPYFSQLGLRPRRPFRLGDLNAPDVYPDDN